jgi:hypothetical protein
MDTQALRDAASNAIRYWEMRRIVYNAILAAIVIAYFGMAYPASKSALTADSILGIFLLAVIANVLFCSAYIVDIFAQLTDFRETWLRFRWILFLVGVCFAGIVTRFAALGMLTGNR